MLRTILPVAILALSSAPAHADGANETVAVALEGAIGCVLSASRDGANPERFGNKQDWAGSVEDGFIANGLPVKVTFPKDDDGIARICVVEATLASQKHQREMTAALEVLLKQKPIEQEDDSMIWMFGRPPDARGLQLFPDKKSDQPEIRFIGAAF